MKCEQLVDLTIRRTVANDHFGVAQIEVNLTKSRLVKSKFVNYTMGNSLSQHLSFFSYLFTFRGPLVRLSERGIHLGQATTTFRASLTKLSFPVRVQCHVNLRIA